MSFLYLFFIKVPEYISFANHLAQVPVFDSGTSGEMFNITDAGSTLMNDVPVWLSVMACPFTMNLLPLHNCKKKKQPVILTNIIEQIGS